MCRSPVPGRDKPGRCKLPPGLWACCYIYSAALSPSEAYRCTASVAEGMKSLHPVKIVCMLGWLVGASIYLRFLYQPLEVTVRRVGCGIKTVDVMGRETPVLRSYPEYLSAF